MTTISSGFAFCVKKFGPPVGGETVPSEVIELYRSRVPRSLLEFWQEYGVGLWLSGRFQLCRPDRYAGLLDMILEGDPDFPPHQSVLIGYTAFGELLIWHNRNYFLEADLIEKIAYTNHTSSKHPGLDPDRELPRVLSHVDRDTYDCFEHTSDAKPLFARAMKKCGKLAFGECYGFFPALGLGGRGVLDEVRRVKAGAHFSIIAQLEPIQLRYMDTENRKIVVLREIGAPRSVTQ